MYCCIANVAGGRTRIICHDLSVAHFLCSSRGRVGPLIVCMTYLGTCLLRCMCTMHILHNLTTAGDELDDLLCYVTMYINALIRERCEVCV